MTALLNTTDPNNRLIEALGSAAFFSDGTSASSPFSLPLSDLALGGGTDTFVDGDQVNTNGQSNTPLDIDSLLGTTGSGTGLTDALPLDHVLNSLPVIEHANSEGILSDLDLNTLDLDNLGLGTVSGSGIPAAGTTPLDLAGAGTPGQPVFDAANALIKDVHYQLEILSHETGTNDIVHAITNLGETVGLGEIGLAPTVNGASNLITDTLNLPGDILSGNLNGGISNIGHDLTDTIHATTGVVGALLHGNDPANPVPEIISGLGSSLQNIPLFGTVVGGTPAAGTTPLDFAGAGTPAQPVFDAANALIKDVHYQLEILSHETGTNDIVHAITNLGETVGLGEIGLAPDANGVSNLITDSLNLPGDILSSNLNGGISSIGHDLTDTIHATTGVVDAVLHGNDPANPVPEIISGHGSSLQNIPLLSINGNNNGGLLNAVIGDLSHSSSGHLIDADVGPQQSNGLVLDLLSAPSNDGHTASVNAVDVGPSGPHLADLGLLTGSSNSDGLAGNLLGGDHGLLSGVTGGGAGTAPIGVVTQVVDILPSVGGLDHGLLDLHSTHII